MLTSLGSTSTTLSKRGSHRNGRGHHFQDRKRSMPCLRTSEIEELLDTLRTYSKAGGDSDAEDASVIPVAGTNMSNGEALAGTISAQLTKEDSDGSMHNPADPDQAERVEFGMVIHLACSR
ncbi:uncharacterized protein [Anabrus simplex]|uniref:uncharacterized protein n=1 Tax=Anabrus simplex TaxID=316456 RepID=UPI0035A333F4